MSARKSSTPKTTPKPRKHKAALKRRVHLPRRDWSKIVERLNRSENGMTRVTMGSDVSAQVTRIRLLKSYTNITAYTKGNVVVLELK